MNLLATVTHYSNNSIVCIGDIGQGLTGLLAVYICEGFGTRQKDLILHWLRGGFDLTVNCQFATTYFYESMEKVLRVNWSFQKYF